MGSTGKTLSLEGQLREVPPSPGFETPAPAPAETTPPYLSNLERISTSRAPFPVNERPLSPGDISDRDSYIFPIRSAVNIEPQPAISSWQSYAPSSPEGAGSTDTTYYDSRSHQSDSAPGTPQEQPLQPCQSRPDTRSGSCSLGKPPPTLNFSRREWSTSEHEFSGTLVQQVGESEAVADSEPEPFGFYTTRHRHVMTEDGHMIVAGIAGAERMQHCEDEPIHIPGAVQGFGCLVALRELENEGVSVLDVRVVSENARDIIGYSPSELFAQGNFLSILSDEQADNFVDHLNFVREATNPQKTSPEVFSLIVTSPDAVRIRLWCAVHLSEDSRDLFICEFELENDSKYPLSPTVDEFSTPTETLQSVPTHEDLMESTVSFSRPLRVSRSGGTRRGDTAAMEVFNLMSQIQDQLSSATELNSLLKIVVGVVKELTGFHRIMIYQFDEAWNGRVVTELVDPRTTRDLYKGLYFPATDIPAQARALYKINKVRLLYDREQTTARLVCKTRKDLETGVDMTYLNILTIVSAVFLMANTAGSLRAMSPIHLKYLGNMGVRASMSISITAFDQLWGLISCHAYGQHGMRVSFPTRNMCRLIGETTSRSIELLSFARRLHARKLINTGPTEQNPSGYIVASSDDLLRLFDADCGLLNIREETKALGKLESSQETLAILEYLRIRKFATVLHSQCLANDFPELKYKPGFESIAGLLLVPLSSDGSDFIVFFRKPQISQVHWAGNPYDKQMRKGSSSYLEPRTSFEIWSETVVGRSREWTEEQIETAAVLCLVYGKFIEVWKQKEAALKNNQLTRLLLSNASHEFRTPLNHIINYLEIALEGPLDTETRDNLAQSHSASKSLIYVINDLLDLTRTEERRELAKDETFNLRDVIDEATLMFRQVAQTSRKKIHFEIVEYPGLPLLVQGDPVRLRQVISNVTENAVKYTSEGSIKIEIWTAKVQDGKCDIEIAIEDTGMGFSLKKLNILFGELEQIHTEEESRPFNALTPDQKALGVGLAVVARAIRNWNGQLKLKSEEGKGSRFTLCIPFTMPQQGSLGGPAIHQGTGATPPPMQDEVTLIPPSRNGKTSSGSPVKVLHQSSSVSHVGAETREIDRIVDAISSAPSAPEYFSAGLHPILSRTSPPNHPILSHHLGSVGPSTLGAPVIERLLAGSNPPGQEIISSSVAPIRPVRLPHPAVLVPSGAVVPLPPPTRPPQPPLNRRFTILAAEDEPINSKIMKKRLEKVGHVVVMTSNGEECFNKFRSAHAVYDAILMDMQMPIMNGREATERIRAFEAKQPTPTQRAPHGRIPIFAVSASLFEAHCAEYIYFGFDGWILKPIDFRRLGTLLEGIRVPAIRQAAEYVPGRWEHGGWFLGFPNPDLD